MQITYITSFGGEEELAATHSKISINFSKAGKGTLGDEIAANRFGNAPPASQPLSYAEKVRQNLEKLKQMNELPKSPRKPLAYQRRSRSRSRSRSKSSYRRHRSSRQSRYRRRSRSRSSRSRSSSRRLV